MKKMILLTVLALMISVVSSGQKLVAKGNTFTALGDYRIETTANPVIVKGQECKAYTVRYANSSMVVTILVTKDKHCKTYLVLSDKLSVQYVCNSSYFGVEKIDKSFQKEGYATSDTNLNRLEYFHQKVLGPGEKTVDEATTLIAAFFPFLINSNETMTAGI
jgi:hypothetical protein